MPRSQYTKELYDTLLDFFRSEGPIYSKAAKHAKCTDTLAKSAYEKGWRGLPWAKPIVEVLQEEENVVRAARLKAVEEQARLEEEVRLEARKDALEARKSEAQGAKLSRGNAIRLSIASTRLLMTMEKIVAEVQTRFNDNGDVQEIPLSELRKWLQLIPQTVKDAQQTMQMALQIERVVTGEPIAILGVKLDQLTPEQMIAQLSGINRTIQRLGELPPELEAEYDTVS